MGGFVFGLFIGVLATSGGSAPTNLGTIPFRCLAAFEVSEADYRDCRRESLRWELGQTRCTFSDIANSATSACSLARNLDWEIAGLRSLRAAIEHRAQGVR